MATFSFGLPSATQTQTPTPAAPFLFSSSFNNLSQQQQQSQPQPTPAPTPTPSFSFGQSQSQASTSLFGSSTAPKPFSLSTPTTSRLPSTSFQQSQPQSQQSQQLVPKLGAPYPPPDSNEIPIETRLETLKNAWDPTNPKCRFQTYFYNDPTPPNGVKAYSQPPPGADEVAWRKAVRENPDPEHLVPALAVGFSSVTKRLDAQHTQSLAHQSRLDEIHTHLLSLSQTHSLETSLRTLKATQTATALTSRLLNLIAKAAALSPNRNMSVRKDEDALRVKLEEMREVIGRTGERGMELWAGVGAVKARSGKEEEGWHVVDEQGLDQVLDILGAQQAGLDHLTKTLNLAMGDLKIMNEAFGIGAANSSGGGGAGTPNRGGPR